MAGGGDLVFRRALGDAPRQGTVEERQGLGGPIQDCPAQLLGLLQVAEHAQPRHTAGVAVLAAGRELNDVGPSCDGALGDVAQSDRVDAGDGRVRWCGAGHVIPGSVEGT